MFKDSDKSAPDIIDLRHNQNIQTLELRCGFNSQMATYIKFLFSLLVAPKIQSITLWLSSRNVTPVGDEWKEVDEILGGKNYAALQEVKIFFRGNFKTHPVDALHDALVQQLPLLASRGILRKGNRTLR